MNDNWLATNTELLFSKNDPRDPRLGEQVTLASWEQNTENSITILGYPDDDGIKLSGGRIGAAQGPDRIRRFLYRMTPPSKSAQTQILDCGNLDIANLELPARHEAGRIRVQSKMTHDRRVLSFGGGHDYGYADGAGFLDVFSGKTEKPVIINFDAHLDVRSPENGLNSGTPFHRLIRQYPSQFHFFEIGIQPQCNSPFHKEWATQHGAQIIPFDGTNEDLIYRQLNSELAKLKHCPIFLSVDIDCFATSIAPGCSQSWPSGLNSLPFLGFLTQLLQTHKVPLMGIYEVAPPLDVQDMTAKWASLLAYHFIFKI